MEKILSLAHIQSEHSTMVGFVDQPSNSWQKEVRSYPVSQTGIRSLEELDWNQILRGGMTFDG